MQNAIQDVGGDGDVGRDVAVVLQSYRGYLAAGLPYLFFIYQGLRSPGVAK